MLCCGRTDIGKKRSVNQDSFICDFLENGMLLAVVCDGMGGAAGGGIASSVACGAFCDYMNEFALEFGSREQLTRTDERTIKNALTKAVEAANDAVFTRSGTEESLRGMGTTLVATLVYCRTLFTVNVGDSRMYLISEGTCQQITHDHSYVQYLVDMGKLTPQEAKNSVNRNIITRAVGTDTTVESDLFLTRLSAVNGITEKIDSEGEYETRRYTVLLCSDGLTNHVCPEEIVVATVPAATAQTNRELGKVVECLIDMANEGGGTDNITAVLLSL